MFETAYSSLLEDDPDSKKKRKKESLKKHTVCFHQNSILNCPLSLCTYLAFVSSLFLLTLQNLLESVPSDEEFKSLLGNPKNIKDCGKSVAESLIILTNCWCGAKEIVALAQAQFISGSTAQAEEGYCRGQPPARHFTKCLKKGTN